MMSLMTIWPVGNFTDVSGVCIRISRALPYLRAITSPPKRDVLQKKRSNLLHIRDPFLQEQV